MNPVYVNALDYVTGGVYDDVAFQKALDAGAGRSVFAGEADWVFNWPVIARTRTRVIGYGSTFTPGPDGLPLLYNYDPNQAQKPGYTGESGITLEGGTLDMRGDVNQVAHNAATFAHCRDITLRDVEFRNVSSYHALEAHSVDGMLVDHCYFYGWQNWLDDKYRYREAVQIDSIGLPGDDGSPCLAVAVERCRFGKSYRPDRSEQCGGWGSAIGSHTVGPGDVHRDITFHRNRVEDTLVYGARALSWSDAHITNNTFDHVGGNAVDIGCADGVTATRAVVQGNVISWPGISGIRVEGDYGTSYTQVEVEDNVVAESGSNGILIADVLRGIAANNQVRNTRNNYAMQLGLGSDHVLHGYLVIGNHLSGAKVRALRINGARYCTIVGNHGSGGMSVGDGNTGTRTRFEGGLVVPGDNYL